MPENLPTPPYTKRVVIDGVEHEVKVLAPTPIQTDERCWPVLKSRQRGQFAIVYDGPSSFVDYINTNEDKRT
jgi:hypothetical protein